MFAQLGSMVFEGLFGFESFETKDTTTYAQYDLINAKPLIRASGNDLQELSIGIRLRVEFINPIQAILKLKKSKDEFEVLSLLYGTGRYVGDFVIVEMGITNTQAFSDGTIIDASLSLTLREYVTKDKLQQQQNLSRQKAFALGDKKPVTVPAVQKRTVPQLATDDYSAITSQGSIVDKNVRAYENNVTQRQTISNKIQASVGSINDKLTSYKEKINSIDPTEDFDSLRLSIDQAKSITSNFQFPITSLDDLKLNNLNLQNSLSNVGTNSTGLINRVITRAA